MDVIYEMAVNMVNRGEVRLGLSPEVADRLQTRSLEILERIRRILVDESLDDPECFYKIEAIVCELEQNGIDCGLRHDFG